MNIDKKIKFKIKDFLTIFFISILIKSPLAFSQMFSKSQIKILEINYDKGHALVLNQIEKHTAQVLSPRDKLDPYFLIRSGVTVSSSRDLRGSLTLFSSVPDKSKTCTGENLYDSSFTIGSNFNSATEKKKIFNSCIKFKVEDPQKGRIHFEPQQTNCKLQRLNEYSALISSGDCFFKISPGQILNVDIAPEANCYDRSFLSQNNFSPSEIQGEWSGYIYPGKEIETIFTPNGAPLFQKKLFINLNPGEELLKLVAKEVEDQTIYRPSTYILPDFILSDFSITNLKAVSGSFANIKFLISTFAGKESCTSDLCSNYSNYDVPFVPSLTLYEIDARSGKKFELKSFFVGDRLPGKWNGFLSQKVNFSGIVFEEGKKYLIELSFSDPVYGYQELKKAYKSLLGQTRMPIGGIGRGESIGTLPTFGTIGTLGTLGTLSGLNTGGFFDGIEGIKDELIPRIVQSINDPTFPPEYTTVCNKDQTKCQNSRTSNFENLQISFEVKSIDSGKNLDFGNSLKVQRMGHLSKSYSEILDFNKRPKIDCGGVL